MVEFNLSDSAVQTFNIPYFSRIKMVVVIQSITSKFKKFIWVIVHPEFFMSEFRHVQNILHPEIIFKSSNFTKMKMMKHGNIFAGISHLPVLEIIHVLYLHHYIVQIIFEPETGSFNKISC